MTALVATKRCNVTGITCFTIYFATGVGIVAEACDRTSPIRTRAISGLLGGMLLGAAAWSAWSATAAPKPSVRGCGDTVKAAAAQADSAAAQAAANADSVTHEQAE